MIFIFKNCDFIFLLYEYNNSAAKSKALNVLNNQHILNAIVNMFYC